MAELSEILARPRSCAPRRPFTKQTEPPLRGRRHDGADRGVQGVSAMIPDSLNGMTPEEIVRRLHEAFTRYGSDALRAALDANAETLTRLWLECSTFDELIQTWERQ